MDRLNTSIKVVCLAALVLLGISLYGEAGSGLSADVSVRVRRKSHGGRTYVNDEVRAKLYFDGLNRWRFDAITWPDHTRINDYFVGDWTRHVLFKRLSPPPTRDVLYHELDVSAATRTSPEAFGLDIWTPDNAEPSCASNDSTCEELRTEKINGKDCRVWRIVKSDVRQRIKSTRTLWFAHDIRALVKIDELEEWSGTEHVHITLVLNNIHHGVQSTSLFELPDAPSSKSIRSAANPAGESSDGQDAYSFRSQSDEILVDVSVRDSKGRLVTGLERDDFRVLADGQERPIAGFWFDEVPLAIALVVDVSGSMRDAISGVRKTAVSVLSRLKPQDEVALFALHQSVDILSDLTRDRTSLSASLKNLAVTDDHSILQWVPRHELGDGTDIVNALFAATLYLKNRAPTMRRIIILISDNQAVSWTVTRNNVRKDENDLIETALLCETAIYSLRIKADLPHGPEISMDKVTEVTGGEMVTSSNAPKMLDEVVAALRKRYLLSFRPSQTQPDGRPHTIEVGLADRFGQRAKDYTVLHRKWYRTPQTDVVRQQP